MAVLDELTERPPHRALVVDEPKDVGYRDVGSESLAVQPEHDLENLVALLEPVDRIDRLSGAEQSPHVLEGGLDRCRYHRRELRRQLVDLGRLTADDEHLAGKRV